MTFDCCIFESISNHPQWHMSGIDLTTVEMYTGIVQSAILS